MWSIKNLICIIIHGCERILHREPKNSQKMLTISNVLYFCTGKKPRHVSLKLDKNSRKSEITLKAWKLTSLIIHLEHLNWLPSGLLPNQFLNSDKKYNILTDLALSVTLILELICCYFKLHLAKIGLWILQHSLQVSCKQAHTFIYNFSLPCDGWVT